MGAPKQLLRHRGATLAEISAGALADVVDRVLVVGDGPVPDALSGLERLGDAAGIPGPLGGVLAALRWAPASAWVVAACDLPLLTSAAVAWLADQRRDDRAAILPRVSERGVEPLLALYEPEALPLIEALTRDRLFAPRHLAGLPGVATPHPPTVLRRQWTNVNSPEDLAALDPGFEPGTQL